MGKRELRNRRHNGIGTLVKDNVEPKTILAKTPMKTWTLKIPNLKIIGIKEGEDSQVYGPENIFNNIIDENFPKLKKKIYINI